MIMNLMKLEDNQFSVVYQGDRGFTIGTYLTEFFISHERYHMKQIQDFLMTKQIM
ncbi:conserved protein of unknown function [Paenibacillus alvei]|uniref:DinB-like domain-containing protein n=1 Tax=Paenibacillus alvei TaxID=44250 RepID=A0A383R9D4_PAEAL|nr:conserved protein of unknown function [Paenibacillus alvei]